MSGLIATNSSWFEEKRQQLIADGWRVEWNDDEKTNVVYRPNGEIEFQYDLEPNEYGTWAALVHRLGLDA